MELQLQTDKRFYDRKGIESDGSENLEPDIHAGPTDTIFIKSPASGKAENRTVAVPLLTFCYWHVAAIRTY